MKKQQTAKLAMGPCRLQCIGDVYGNEACLPSSRRKHAALKTKIEAIKSGGRRRRPNPHGRTWIRDSGHAMLGGR